MKKTILIVLSLLLLSGCWDERQFKNVKLVLTMGFDKGENGGILETVSIPTAQRSSEGLGKEKVQIVSSEAATPYEARSKINSKISNSFDPSKVKMLIIGEELAKENIYGILDEFYRNPNNNLNAYAALAKGKAQDIISYQDESIDRISDHISGIINGAVTATHAPGENIQLICAELFEPGEDFVLPLLTLENDGVVFSGLGLFHDTYYTGEDLSPEEGTILMLLEGIKGRVARITKKISEEHEIELMNYITVSVMKLNRDLKIKTKGDQISVLLDLSLKVRIIEYPFDHLTQKGKKQELAKKLSDALTKDAEQVIKKIQEANSDVLSIGRKVHAYHPDIYKKLDWNEAYPEITITPKVEVDIFQHGVIN